MRGFARCGKIFGANEVKSIKIFFLLMALWPTVAFAGDGATIIFNSGQIVKIDDGFRQVVEAIKSQSKDSNTSRFIELNLGGGTFLLNLNEIAIVCRDNCTGLTIQHQLDPKRGATKIGIDQSKTEYRVIESERR